MVWLSSYIAPSRQKQTKKDIAIKAPQTTTQVFKTLRAKRKSNNTPEAITPTISTMTTLPPLVEDSEQISSEQPNSVISQDDIESQNAPTPKPNGDEEKKLHDRVQIPTPYLWGLIWINQNYEIPNSGEKHYDEIMDDLARYCDKAQLSLDRRINLFDSFHKIASGAIVGGLAVIEGWLERNPGTPEEEREVLRNLQFYIPIAASFFALVGVTFRDRNISLKAIAVESEDRLNELYEGTNDESEDTIENGNNSLMRGPR